MSDTVIVALIAAVPATLAVLIQLVTHGKVRATHHQVSVNNHSSKAPTILDKIDDLGRRFDKHEELHERERNG